MAAEFGVDARLAGRTATEIGRIRTTVTGLGGLLAGQGDVTGSARVRQALEDFVADSSDARDRMDGQLERAGGMLSGLSTGATTLDNTLAEAVTPQNPPAQPVVQPVVQPNGRPTGRAV
jgi:hypothetical protein